MSKFSLITKITALLSIILIIYGYTCRAFDIFIFWESKTIGWIIFKIALISFFVDFIAYRKEQEKKSLFFKIGIGFTVFAFIIQSILLVAFYNSDAYSISKKYAASNDDIKSVTGEIQGFSILGMGGIKTETSNGISSGNAEINFTIKGSKKFIDTTMWLYINEEGEWVIDGYTLWINLK